LRARTASSFSLFKKKKRERIYFLFKTFLSRWWQLCLTSELSAFLNIQHLWYFSWFHFIIWDLSAIASARFRKTVTGTKMSTLWATATATRTVRIWWKSCVQSWSLPTRRIITENPSGAIV
jgi:hypothetical protein